MDNLKELSELIVNLQRVAKLSEDGDATAAIKALTKSGKHFESSFSGSWLGYHSRVYYENFQKPPPGAHFSQEWGLSGEQWLGLGSNGAWLEYDFDVVKQAVLKHAGNPNLVAIADAKREAVSVFQTTKSALESILATEIERRHDDLLQRSQKELQELSLRTEQEILEALHPSRQVMTRDTVAIGQGAQAPPHIAVQLVAFSALHAFATCKQVAEVAEKVKAHLARRQPKREEINGSSVFIGHGQDATWKELKDFLNERLNLRWDEFNRVPVAGMSNKERLTEMLNNASFAFLVLTAEDERSDGVIQARENVLHETGLFQGKLGFNRAIILLEDGCNEFTNIAGLGQIRFAKGQLSAKFEEIRRVLEREGIVV